ncbi:methyltransferase [Aureococcus anophagefferens]|nr:methyltransferase [Aureococcus anophagefferens]
MDLASMSAAELAALAEQVRAAREALEARDAHAAQEAQEAPADAADDEDDADVEVAGIADARTNATSLQIDGSSRPGSQLSQLTTVSSGALSESEDDMDLDARFVPREKPIHDNEVTLTEGKKYGTILYPAEVDYGHLENGMCKAPVMCVGYMPFQQFNPKDGSGEKRVAVHNSLLFQPGDRKPKEFVGTYEDLARLWAAGVETSVLTKLRRGCVFSWVPSDPAPAWVTERLGLHGDDTFEYLMLCFALNVRPWIPFMGIMFREWTRWLAEMWKSKKGAPRARAISNFNERCLEIARGQGPRAPPGRPPPSQSCIIPGCKFAGSELDHRACTRKATGAMCPHHNTGIATAYGALGARAIAMAAPVGHVKAGRLPSPAARAKTAAHGPQGGFY